MTLGVYHFCHRSAPAAAALLLVGCASGTPGTVLYDAIAGDGNGGIDGGGIVDSSTLDSGGGTLDSGGGTLDSGGGTLDSGGGTLDANAGGDGGGNADGGGTLDSGGNADGGGTLDSGGNADGGGGTLGKAFSGPYYEHDPSAPLDVSGLVTGGAQPYGCSFLTGAGRGTRPGAMTLSGCTLSGGFASADPPGLYGFVVIVEDDNGAKIEIFIAVRNGTCNSAAASLTPAPYPVRVVSPPGSAYAWTLALNDSDYACTDVGCSTCGSCLDQSLNFLGPLTVGSGLDCASAGDVCFHSNGFTQPSPATCPSSNTYSGEVRVRAHAPLRANGAPAWATLATTINYSGDTVTQSTCGGKTWACHWETLELAP